MERQGRRGRQGPPAQTRAMRNASRSMPLQDKFEDDTLSVSSKTDFPSDGHSSRIPAKTINGKEALTMLSSASRHLAGTWLEILQGQPA
ncbi:hypothetical protein CMUS01_08285 [Colletotrichum musicola]|uniref:Uncharacterized protein n=1 Tax=Colletotrichum musicola TaxID=2175873 RepID=A0A8H6KDK7_9PEZI|nr:hypothetical protein CMUS01_08285 [Colletotrichum musicola]